MNKVRGPDALPIELTGGIGGPACMIVVWPNRHWGGWDYGWGGCWGAQFAGPTTTLWTGVGTIDPTIPGSFDILIPAGAMATWPLRCRWAVLFDWNGGGNAEMLAEGHLHIRPMVSRSIVPVIMLTDNPVDAIFIDGAPPSAGSLQAAPGPVGPVVPPVSGYNLPNAQPDGSPPVGAKTGDLYTNGGFVCVTP